MSADVTAQAPLVQHFDLIAQAPGGVTRLRELILTLAVQGKLVPQDPSDEPASEQLKKIRVEKDRLIAEGKIKRDKQPVEITDEEKPFELPEGWVWVRNSNLFSLRKGKVPKNISDKSEGVPYLDIDALDRNIVKRYSTDASAPMCTCEDILVVCDGSRSGLVLQGQDGIVGSTLSVIDTAKQIQPFIQLIFKAGFNRYNSGMKGAAIPHLDTKVVLAEVIGLPPLDEQSRIDTRVEELMQLCDALEASGQLEGQQHAQLVNTLLGTLNQSETTEALADNWQRIASHFDVLLDRPEAVDALEQNILQLAVRGLLVPQDPTDEPASVLLQKIRTEKDHLIAQGKIKRDKPLPPITDEEKPFELPRMWEWVRLGSLGESFDYGSSQKSVDDSKAVPILRMGNIQQGEIVMRNLKYLIDQEGDLPKLLLRDGDLLFNRTNSYELVGKTALFHNFEREVTFASYLIRIRLVLSMCSAEYVNIYMNTRDCRMNEIEPDLTQQTGQANYNGTKLKGIRIPVPPLGEQFRIVTRVNELRKICAVLRQRMVSSRALQSHLAEVFSGG